MRDGAGIQEDSARRSGQREPGRCAENEKRELPQGKGYGRCGIPFSFPEIFRISFDSFESDL